jgi:hypothetical protein
MIRKILLMILISITTISLFSCKTDIGMDLVPQKQLEFTKKYLEIIRENKLDSLKKVLAFNLVEVIDEEALSTLSIYFPTNEDPKNILLIGSNNVEYGDSSTTEITLQYEFSNNFVLGDLFLITKNDQIKISGIHINPISVSLEKTNELTFSNKSFVHYLFLMFGILSFLFIIYTLIVCAKSKINKKWLWIIFILFGFSRLMLNWTTGKVAVSIIAFQLFGFGITSSGLYAPWIVSISFPLGAIIFLIKRKNIIIENTSESGNITSKST